MKIDILHYSVPPIVGGVEAVIGHHAKLITEAGHTVRLLAGRGAQTDDRIEFVHLPLADSIEPRILALKSELDRGRVPAGFNATVSELESQLRLLASEADILIAHNVCSLHKNLALSAAVKRLAESTSRPQIVLWHHDLAWITPRYRHELYAGYPWNLLQQDWPGVTQVVVSRARQVELAELFGIQLDRINVIPNGIDLNQFLKLEPFTTDLVNQLQLLQTEPLFLLPVRITPRKNIETAMRVIQQLLPTYPRAMLVVSGPPGPHNPANQRYYSSLLALRRELGVEHAVAFLTEITSEYLPDVVIFDLYRLADALLLPSLEEGFGIPLLEAGLAGVPAFCASISTLRELGEGAVVYFPPDGDAFSIANLIKSQLINNRSYSLKMKVRTRYSWERIFKDQIAPVLNL